MGARTLARLLASKHGQKAEDRRRTINRWLAGKTPLEANRHMVEDALELPRDSLKGADEDDEEDSLSFDAILERRVHELVELELRKSHTLERSIV